MMARSHILGAGMVLVTTGGVGLVAAGMGMPMESLVGPPGIVLLVFAIFMYSLGVLIERQTRQQDHA